MNTSRNQPVFHKASPSTYDRLVPYGITLLLIALTDVAMWLLRDQLTIANFTVIYMLVTIIVAVWLGTWPSILAAVVSFFSINFLLVQPYYTLIVEDPTELLDLIIFLAAALIVGRLTSYAQRQAESSRQMTAEQITLYHLTSNFNQQTDRAAVMVELQRVALEEVGATRLELLTGEKQPLPPSANSLYILLHAGESVYGTLRAAFAQVPSESQQRLLGACAVQASLAIQRIELTEQARHSEILGEADALKTALLRAVSHDLRTPITIIRTSAANLAELDAHLSGDERQELARTIELEADHLNRLVGNLLDMSRLQAGALVLNLEWNSLEEIAGEVAAKTYASLGKERLTLSFPDELALVWCDYGLMVQAVGNLVENSLRYEPANSQVIISGEAAESTTNMRIQNHGPTIPNDQKAHVMEPFYQSVDGHYSSGHSGLGLAIARGIVEAHRGYLAIEDTPGGGATFVIALPSGEPSP